jgi:hypothetical protein
MSDPKRLAQGIAAAVCFVLGLFARPVRADETTNRRLVVVLRPHPGSAETWPEGTQAVVAELVAGGYELLLRASVARDRDGLLAELVTAASERPVQGAVVVLREGERGIAYVYTEKTGTVPVETGVSEGAVGEGAVALRIAQVLGPPELDVPQSRRAPAVAPRADVSPPPATPAEPAHSTLLVAVGGLILSSDLSEPLPIAGLGLRQRLIGPLSVDAAAALSLGASRIETDAGSVDVSAQELKLYLSFDPVRDGHFGFSLGLGGVLVFTQGEGSADDGFSAKSDSARVALLSARAALTFTHADWSLLLGVEPGVLLPAVDVSGGSETVRLGRPWTTTSIGLGWNF